MVKVYGPMMSLDASGTLADAITFSKWKGRNYVRERVIPSNPKSGAQTGRRALFAFLTQNWAGIAAALQDTWQDRADQLVASKFNAYLSENMNRWHNFLAPGVGDPVDESDAVGVWTATPTAAWEENRIKISGQLVTLNQNWLTFIFASTTTPVVSSVGVNILVPLLDDTAAHEWFWTPPSVATWYFNTRLGSMQGVLGAEGTEFSAVP